MKELNDSNLEFDFFLLCCWDSNMKLREDVTMVE